MRRERSGRATRLRLRAVSLALPRRIGINALFLEPRMGGLETYVRALVPEKSPSRKAAVGTVRKADAFCRRTVRSQSAKKKSLFFLMGPPKVPPN